MFLLYAYIAKYKNYENQEIVFDHDYQISFTNSELSIRYCGKDPVKEMLRGNGKPDQIHLLVGKTGSGKTNLLQLIGMTYEARTQRKWDGADDSYFFLYKVRDREFLLEICDLAISQFPTEQKRCYQDIPQNIKPCAERMDTVRTVKFRIDADINSGQIIKEFTVPAASANELAVIINSFDIHAFIELPYSNDKKIIDEPQDDWIARRVHPYHRTSLGSVCRHIRAYQSEVERGVSKLQVAFVLTTHNFADQYPVQLPEKVEREYWTFWQRIQDEQVAQFDEGAVGRVGRRKRKKPLTQKQMFIHDLWTDYAKYLRKWIMKIHNYNGNSSNQPIDPYQEMVNHYVEKNYKDAVDATRLPDGIQMGASKRCNWLAQYIDRIDNRDPHGVLWQAVDDIRDICKILSQLDEKYFTVDTFSIPVVDMELSEHQELFYDLFERMDAYEPDDAGIFTENLLPYKFTHLSTGEYQYAKVLGGIDDSARLFIKGDGSVKLNKIVLMDEPEAYMHPELARQFVRRLYQAMGKNDKNTVQVIIGTHSPFMLSDVLPCEITRLDIDSETGNAIVINGSSKEYFGANIHTILADSFFLDFTIGDYARGYLQSAFKRLENYAGQDNLSEEAKMFVEQMRQMLPHIGDELIRRAFEIILGQLEQ